MKSAAAQGAREIGEATCASHRHYLLANFESLKDKANELRRSLLPAYHKLAALTPSGRALVTGLSPRLILGDYL